MGVDCVFYLPFDIEPSSNATALRAQWLDDLKTNKFPGAEEDSLIDEKGWCTKPVFAYCRLEIDEKRGYFIIHDGCRLKLNIKNYQIPMLNYLNNLRAKVLPNDKTNIPAFVMGDCDQLPWEYDLEEMDTSKLHPKFGMSNLGSHKSINFMCLVCDTENEHKADVITKCKKCSSQSILQSCKSAEGSYNFYHKPPSYMLYDHKYGPAGYDLRPIKN
jgi:hypothetical protein